MTDLAAATADTSTLPDYGGRSVARTTLSIRNAGDGLSEGLSIAPQVLPLGQTVYVVLECVVDAHDHVRLKDRKSDTGLLVLDQVLKAGTGTIVDAELVRDVIAAQAERILRAREAAQGLQRLPYDDTLQAQHDEGEHADGLVAGCPDCEAERDADAADAAAADGNVPVEPTPITKRKRT